MARKLLVPAHAVEIDRVEGRCKDGAAASVAVYEGHASDGYKTDYVARPARWYVIRVEGQRPFVQRCTGKRFGDAMDALRVAREELR